MVEGLREESVGFLEIGNSTARLSVLHRWRKKFHQWNFFIPPGLVERALSGGGAAIQHLPAFEKAHKKGTANFFSRARSLFFEART